MITQVKLREPPGKTRERERAAEQEEAEPTATAPRSQTRLATTQGGQQGQQARGSAGEGSKEAPPDFRLEAQRMRERLTGVTPTVGLSPGVMQALPGLIPGPLPDFRLEAQRMRERLAEKSPPKGNRRPTPTQQQPAQKGGPPPPPPSAVAPPSPYVFGGGGYQGMATPGYPSAGGAPGYSGGNPGYPPCAGNPGYPPPGGYPGYPPSAGTPGYPAGTSVYPPARAPAGSGYPGGGARNMMV